MEKLALLRVLARARMIRPINHRRLKQQVAGWLARSLVGSLVHLLRSPVAPFESLFLFLFAAPLDAASLKVAPPLIAQQAELRRPNQIKSKQQQTSPPSFYSLAPQANELSLLSFFSDGLSFIAAVTALRQSVACK